ncbi:hypothetical protein, partial [Klebsiella pneumoniae]
LVACSFHFFVPYSYHGKSPERQQRATPERCSSANVVATDALKTANPQRRTDIDYIHVNTKP